MLSDRIEGSIKTGVGRLQDGAGGVTGDLGLQTRGKLNETAGFVQDLAGQAKDKFADVAGSAKERISAPLGAIQDLVRTNMDRNEERLDEIKAMVIKNPLAAIGVVAVAGILLGLLLKRSDR